MARIEREPVPVTVISGFLGAGKTTLLRRILSDPQGRRFGVLVNDFGEINIDSALIVESAVDQISLSNGCVCCTIQDDLIAAVRSLVADRPDIDRILIEASGVSRSIPIVETVEAPELQPVVALDGVFCVVDAAMLPGLDYAAMELAIDQITGADMLILNKTDLVSKDEKTALHERLRGIMPTIRIVPAIEAQIPQTLMFGIARQPDAACLLHKGNPCACSDAHAHAHDHDHAHDHVAMFASWSWRSAIPLDETRFRAALRKLPTAIMRAKGVVHLRRDGETRAMEFHLVGKRSTLQPVADGLARSQPDSTLVLIGLREAVDPQALQAMFESCIGIDA